MRVPVFSTGVNIRPPYDLEALGFRFVRRSGLWSWTHPAEVRPDDLDATDWTDEQFEAQLRADSITAPNIER